MFSSTLATTLIKTIASRNPSTAANVRRPWMTETMRMVPKETSVIRARTMSKNVTNMVVFIEKSLPGQRLATADVHRIGSGGWKAGRRARPD
jgi:hypothetical protein